MCARSARALIKAEAEVENEEKLGEAAMQFFYGNKVLIFWHGGGPGPYLTCNSHFLIG